MVAKKSKVLTLSTAALDHGCEASAAKYVKKGFAFTDEMDLAFALGYPNFVYLADGHPADEDPAVKGPEFIADSPRDIRIWPRQVAYRAGRAWTSLNKPPVRAERFKEDKGPITEAEAREIVGKWLRADRGDMLLLLIEAMVGPDVVVDAAIEAMERYDEEDWDGANFDTSPYTLGFILMRLPAPAAAKARSRLEAVYTKVQKAGWQFASIKSLDVMLHGVEGAERSAYRPSGKHISRMFTTLVADDPTWVAKHVLAGGPPDSSLWPDPRLAFLGGEEVLDAECSWWNKYARAGSHAIFVERFGHICSEKLLPVFLEMTTASKAKKEAAAWFAAHADFARDFLEQQAKAKGGDAASALLKAING